MAGALVSQLNQYTEQAEGLTGDDLARRGLSQASGGGAGGGPDLASKAFSFWRDPQYRFVFTTTTAADSATSTLNMVTATRTINDPQASPSNPLTKLLGPLAGALTSGVTRPVRVRVKQSISATVVHVFWFHATILGGATPTVIQPALAALTQLGTRRAADDQVNIVAAAGSLLLNVVHGTTNANITWTVDVFTDDPL